MGYRIGKLFTGLVVAAALTISGAARADADVSTPKKAAVSFAKAVSAGDTTAMKALSIGTDAEFALVKSLSDVVASTRKLEEAAAKKFGEEGKLPKEMSMDLVTDLETGEEKIAGDHATLITKNKPEDQFPMTLKKEGEGWKVELSNLAKDPMAAAMAQMIPTMVKGMDIVTKNINDGKYKTAAEAFTDLAVQMAGAASIELGK